MSLQIELQPYQFNNTIAGLSSATFNSISAVSLSGIHYGDGSRLTGIQLSATDLSFLSVSGNWNTAYNWVSTNSTNAVFRTVSATSLSGVFYGDGSRLTGIQSSGSSSYNYVSSSFTAIASNNYMVDTTTSTVTATLPTNPSLGIKIGFLDPYNTWLTNSFTLSSNLNIENQNQTVYINVSGLAFNIIYAGGSYGWKITQ